MLLSKIRISGHSMEPFLKDNDMVLASGIFYRFINPSINDIVCFKFNNKILIKRITKIQNNKYFVKGDNSKDSLDSDEFGLIKKENILGKVFYKLT